jgi:hypothetical protein
MIWKNATPESLLPGSARRWLGGLLAALACSSLVTVAVAEPAAMKRAAAKEPAKPHSLPCPAHLPEALNPPPEATLEQGLPAHGVQIYACTGSKKPGEAPSWTLEAPHALLTSGAQVAAIHFGGPIWQGLDGSQVKGAKLASADAPDAAAVPWLLLSATSMGAGTFAETTLIQRLETVGGKAPATGCDPDHVGAKVLVPYRANYFFYRKAAAGERVRQCHSEPPKPRKS